jgi:predicted metalloprotease with PDZ domain
MIARRAGLSDEQTMFGNFEKSFNATENDPGRKYQSLVQASYETWSDGPFGSKGKDGDRSISYYDKGPLVGLLLDLAIRHASGNKKSLDDVMRFLYNQYYKELNRGFTDAEFQQSCERIAGSSLSALFEFVYTTREPDYNTYLAFAGLKLTEKTGSNNGTRQFVLERIDNPDASQVATLQAWLGK